MSNLINSGLGMPKKGFTRRKRGIAKRSPNSLTSPPPAMNLTLGQTLQPDTSLVNTKTDGLVVNLTQQEREILLARAQRRMKDLSELEVDSISYSVFSHEELMEKAVFKVKSTDDEGLHTVNDPRSGVVDNGKLCLTCHADNLTCPGHFGALVLNQHIVHPIKMRLAVDVLISVCNSCAGLLLPKEIIYEKGINELTGAKRLRAIADASKKIHCRRTHHDLDDPNSGPIRRCAPNPIYKTSKIRETGKIMYTNESKHDSVRTVEEIEEIFNEISEEDALLMGFEGKSHPKRFILKSLPIIPLCARAPVFQDGMILKDDITSMYIDIVRHNLALNKPGLQENERSNIVKSLIFSISHLIDNSDGKYKQTPKKSYLGYKGRIQSKEGYIRNLIQGKRVNFAARTVLGPDPTLKFGQIRIPTLWAPYLTYPETVTAQNMGRLTRLFRDGKVTHITPSQGKLGGRRLKVNDNIRANQNLAYGDIVDRWLHNGDYVAFNRQPTLHKQGLMGYEVVLGDAMTIGLHLACTPPHNADFDGDEGTVHAPQSIGSRMELATIMNVKNNIMNSQNNKNIIGVVYNALTGSYLLTQPETYVAPDVYGNVVSFLVNKDSLETIKARLEKYDIPETSGRALFSTLFPEDFYYREHGVLIRDGILINGVINKSHIGSSHRSIIQVMMKDYGQDRTVDFITDIYFLVGKWLDTRSFSVGLDDCYLEGTNPESAIQFEIERAKMLVKSMGYKLSDPLEEERREKQIINYLNNARDFGARISKEKLGTYNALNVMAKSGAKGSTFNIAQITGLLGQQFVQGKRMPENAFPHFPKGSLDPAARGFCYNSFLKGLSPTELFAHQAGSREGLTDTAIKTSDTGHMHHRMVKALEDIKVFEDGSVRNAFGYLFQFAYGEDGFDAGLLEGVETKTGKFSSYINTKRLAGKLNAKFGYKTPGEPEFEKISPLPHIFMKSNDIGTTMIHDGEEVIIIKTDGNRMLVQGSGNPVWINN
jgi:DNA-directed RNA polymerase beta' subunit